MASLLAVSFLVASVAAQQSAIYTPEVHPKLPSYKCTTANGCVLQNTSIVLDAQYRWIHNKDGYANCYNGGFNATFCPDVTTCGETCTLEGVDYSTYGIQTNGTELTLDLFVNRSGVVGMSSPRVYLVSPNDTQYDMFQLLNQEFTFDVDVSAVPCGINGALYFSEMDASGNYDPVVNPAGAKYGTGYCDAQCPKNNWVNGKANLDGTLGACCNEMDIWEANNAANAVTPHPCNITSATAVSCTGGLCGRTGVCDQDGCDLNPYRLGNHGFYGLNGTVNSKRKFTVVTQFITHDNTSTGNLVEIRRLYVQDGRVHPTPSFTIPGMTSASTLSDRYCQESKKVLGGADTFTAQGGLTQMGKAIGRGMVLAMSIWDDSGSSGMLWLDGVFPKDGNPASPGVSRGPCGPDSGNTTMIAETYTNAKVVFSNIKSGDIGSTFGRRRRGSPKGL